MSAALLDIEGLSVTFETESGPLPAVVDVDLDVHAGEVVALVGESGSGKSVTALSVLRLLPRSAMVAGSIRFDGADVLAMAPDEVRRLRGGDVAIVFQDPMTALNPVLRVGDQIVEAVRAHQRVSRRAARDRAAALLDLVGIPEARARLERYPHEFSGGMRQRVLIAIAVANEPRLLIADEPTTALDVTIQAQVLEVLAEVRERTSAALLLITHDLALVAGVADRVAVMYAGRIFETADTATLYRETRNPYTRGLLTSLPRFGADAEPLPLQPIPGRPPDLRSLGGGCPFRPRCGLADDRCLEEPALREVGLGHRSRCHHAEALAATGAEVGA